MSNNELIETIRSQTGSNGDVGWPTANRDRIHYPSSSEDMVTDASTGVAFLWTVKEDVLPGLERDNLARATNFYNPSGI